MSAIIRRIKILNIALDSTNPLPFLRNNLLFFRPSSSKSSIDFSGLYPEQISPPNKEPWTISYLVKSCGFSPEKANSISEKLNSKTLERPISVLDFFRNYGFSKSQIADLVRTKPLLLLCRPDNVLSKLEFFRSVGVSKIDLAKTLTRIPFLVSSSLNNQIIPAYNFLKPVLHSNEKILAALPRTLWVFQQDKAKNFQENVTLLKKLEVPESCIALVLTYFTEAILQKHDQFKDVVNEVMDMGFDPLKSAFVLAVHCLSGKNKLIWKRSYHDYSTRWGWSEEDIKLAFMKHPLCMILSEKKISRAMEFLVKELGFPPREIAKSASVLCLSFEKRIIPRCSVIKILLSMGLLKKVSLNSVLRRTEKYFVERYVTKYEKEVPDLLFVYRRNLKQLEDDPKQMQL